MYLHIARFRVKPGQQKAFEASAAKGEALFLAAKGCRGFNLTHSLESPEDYLLMVHWESVENHTKDFRASPARDRWHDLVDPYIDGPPEVEHVRLLGEGPGR